MIDLSTRSDEVELIEALGPMALVQHYVARLAAWPWLPVTLVGLAILSAVLIPLNLLTGQPFHHDEALYATWALQIASGDNPLLTQVPVDKPPLFLYTMAGAMWLLGATETIARLPSLLATALTVGLTFWLGQKLYSRGVGLIAAWLVALSPLTIFFAPTAFTDPMLVALVLAACLAAAYGRAAWSGVWLGLAIATKQQGLFFVPLVLGIFVCVRLGDGQAADGTLFAFSKIRYLICRSRASKVTSPASRLLGRLWRFLPDSAWLLVMMMLTVAPTFIWDLARIQIPGYWRQSLLNYGHLAAGAPGFGERLLGFVELLQYGTASPSLNILFILGLPLLLMAGVWRIFRLGEANIGDGLIHRLRRLARGSRSAANDNQGIAYARALMQRWPAVKEPIFQPAAAPGLEPQFQRAWPERPAYPPVLQAASYQLLRLPETPTEQSPALHQAQTDWILFLFSLVVLLGHALFSFQVWDRYLLCLVPFLALILARVLLPWSLLKNRWLKRRPDMRPLAGLITALVLGGLLALALVRPVQDAANARYPLGSNSSALRGIEQVTAYLQGNIGANTTLYHRWLGTHWRFYLHNYPYDLQYWATPQALAAAAQPGHLIAFPTWRSETEARLALAEAGLALRELSRAYSPAGHPSIILYRIETR